MTRLINLIINLLLVVLVTCGTFAFALCEKQPELAFKPTTLTANALIFDLSPAFSDKAEIKAEVDTLFGNPPYTYAESDISDWGLTYMPQRHIVIDSELSLAEYTFTLAHELVHLTESHNERWANYKAFVVLYESENEYFQNVAVFGAWLDLAGFYSKEYQFVGHVEQYLLHV